MPKNLDEPNAENYWCEPHKAYFVYAVTYPKSSPKDVTYAINVSGGGTVYDIPSSNFTVIDETFPQNWQSIEYEANGVTMVVKTFPEWAQDEHFFAKLWDDDQDTSDIFRKYAQKYEELAHNYSRDHSM